MDLGTGKDLDEYTVNGEKINHHIIDIRDAGYKYNVYEFQKDFLSAYNEIKGKGKIPGLCGGTGMYIESVLKGYKLLSVPENKELRESLAHKSLDELAIILSAYKKMHNKTDIDTAKRAVREIEIQEYYKNATPEETELSPLNSLIIGVDIDREERRRKISKRLKERLEEGMVEEVKALLDSGIAPEDLIYYGLEYKYLTLYLTGKLSYEEMTSSLEIAIHQFAKRQMTWFRGMEKRGLKINWIDYTLSMDDKVNSILELINN